MFVFYCLSHNLVLICNFSFTYKSTENQKILSRLLDEVKALNSHFIIQHIRGNSSNNLT